MLFSTERSCVFSWLLTGVFFHAAFGVLGYTTPNPPFLYLNRARFSPWSGCLFALSLFWFWHPSCCRARWLLQSLLVFFRNIFHLFFWSSSTTWYHLMPLWQIFLSPSGERAALHLMYIYYTTKTQNRQTFGQNKNFSIEKTWKSYLSDRKRGFWG